MKTRRFVAVGLIASATIVAAGIALNLQQPPEPHQISASSQGDEGEPAQLKVHGTPTGENSSRPTATSESTATPAPPGRVGTRTSTEILPPTATATVPTLPPSAPKKLLLSGPLPASANARGRVVVGYPPSIAAVPGSDIHATSVSTDQGRVQAALDASVGKNTVDVVAYYQSALAPFGLNAAHAPAVAGSTAYSFSRGPSTISLTVTAAGMHGCHYVLFATLTPDS